MKAARDIDGALYVLQQPGTTPVIGDYVIISDHLLLWRVTRKLMNGTLYLLSHEGKRFATLDSGEVRYVYRDPQYQYVDHRGEYSTRYI